MTKEGVRLLTVEPEDMFGELSLLYNCTHTYSVSGIGMSQTLRFLAKFVKMCIEIQGKWFTQHKKAWHMKYLL